MHIDEWIDDPIIPSNDNFWIRYAKWFFVWKRMPAWLQLSVNEFYNNAKLFCIYKSNKYRCTGASSMGDVSLVEDFNREHGYDLRVNVEECSNWSAE